ncbi:MAG TPA: hypothetical protein VGP72_22175 [Planctomycetota bacterium]|jgi:hypothetical protein
MSAQSARDARMLLCVGLAFCLLAVIASRLSSAPGVSSESSLAFAHFDLISTTAGIVLILWSALRALAPAFRLSFTRPRAILCAALVLAAAAITHAALVRSVQLEVAAACGRELLFPPARDCYNESADIHTNEIDSQNNRGHLGIDLVIKPALHPAAGTWYHRYAMSRYLEDSAAIAARYGWTTQDVHEAVRYAAASRKNLEMLKADQITKRLSLTPGYSENVLPDHCVASVFGRPIMLLHENPAWIDDNRVCLIDGVVTERTYMKARFNGLAGTRTATDQSRVAPETTFLGYNTLPEVPILTSGTAHYSIYVGPAFEIENKVTVVDTTRHLIMSVNSIRPRFFLPDDRHPFRSLPACLFAIAAAWLILFFPICFVRRRAPEPRSQEPRAKSQEPSCP